MRVAVGPVGTTFVIVPPRGTVASVGVPDTDVSTKVTLPVGIPAPGEVTVSRATNVTLWPKTDGLPDVVRPSVVAAWFTVCVMDVAVDPAKSVSPLYIAVIASDPTGREEVVTVATPMETVPVPIVDPPLVKVTVPVGVPAPGAVTDSVAVNVTGWPKTVGFVPLVTTRLVLAVFTVCVPADDVELLKFMSPE
jgi:hypothetical protein